MTDEKKSSIVSDYANAGFVALGMAMGQKVGLFDVLIKLSSNGSWNTPVEIAAAAKLKERYVREWCKAMGCAGVIEMDESGGKFKVLPERVMELYTGLPFVAFVPLMSQVFGDIEQCFQPNGPNVPELQEKLNTGIVCLDVGCGLAEPSRNLAKKFPKSQFYAIDFSESSIGQAKELAAKRQLDNVHFYSMDAAHLDENWTDKFDWVTAVDAIHDQAYPRKVLKEIERVLKPGSRFSMIDVKGTSNAYEDKKALGGGNSAGHYMASLFHCMPVSLYFEGGEGLGTMWGAAVATELLTEAGLTDVKTFNTKHPILTHYLSQKPAQCSNL